MKKEASELPEFVEFEVKFRVSDPTILWGFKKKMQETEGLKSFLYVESDDVYYTKDADEFLRHRLGSDDGNHSRSELTIKRKIAGASNNIIREEVNVRVEGNEPKAIERFAELLGYRYNFRINKSCHIYFFGDANVVFYSVRDVDRNDLAHFLEIEVLEGAGYTEEQSWEIIRKYEAILEISAQKRLKKSLFEMYRREKA